MLILFDDQQVLNLAGKTSLLGLAALIKGAKFFIGLDSVASHIAASVNKESITLFGPSNPINWKPWSDRAKIIVRNDLKNIEVGEVISLVEEMYPQSKGEIDEKRIENINGWTNLWRGSKVV